LTVAPSGKPPRKLPERADALNVPLPFDDAIKAALETKPPPEIPKRRKKLAPRHSP
jgi:hypothetical protein